MPLTKKKFTIKNDINESISLEIRQPGEKDFPERYPAVFVLHGFKAWKDWGFFPYISEKIALAGNIVINFNFSMNGVPDGQDLYLEPEKFAANTISRELADAGEVLDLFLRNNFVGTKDCWNGEIIFLGHSRGAAISILLAAQRQEISKLILWAPISRFGRITERQVRESEKAGFMEFRDVRTGQVLRINHGYNRDLQEHREEYSLPARISGLTIPVLLLHGRQDVTVPFRESTELFENLGQNNGRLVIVEKTGHTFGVNHPFVSTTPALEEVLLETMDFLKDKK